MTVRTCGILFLMTAISGCGPAVTTKAPAKSAADWPLVNGREEGFTVRMPIDPIRHVTPPTADDPGDTQYSAETDTESWLVMSSSYEKNDLTTKERMDNAVAGGVGNDKKLVRQTAITIPGAEEAREVVVTAEQGVMLVSRCVIGRGRMYLVIYTGPKERIDAQETRWFLESFQLTGLSHSNVSPPVPKRPAASGP